MAKFLTVEEIVPVVEVLAPTDRARLICLIAKLPTDDGAIYALHPPPHDEFQMPGNPGDWESEG